MKLSNRLQLIADKIEAGETMADLGTDHGFLPMYLWQIGKCPHVIMADISKGSLDKAKQNCMDYFPDNDFDFRLGNGMEILENNEVDSVVIAGMGGILISQILGKNEQKTKSIKKYILQPRNNVGKLRWWMYNNNFDITDESLVREGKFICEIITAKPTEETREPLDFNESFIYPKELLSHKTPLLIEYINRKIELEQFVLEKVGSQKVKDEIEMERIRARINLLQEMLKEVTL